MDEQKRQMCLKSLTETAERKLGEKYEEIIISGRRWFRISETNLLHLCLIKSFGAIVFEHAYSEENTVAAEDGDMFYFDDYDSDEALLADLLEKAYAIDG